MYVILHRNAYFKVTDTCMTHVDPAYTRPESYYGVRERFCFSDYKTAQAFCDTLCLEATRVAQDLTRESLSSLSMNKYIYRYSMELMPQRFVPSDHLVDSPGPHSDLLKRDRASMKKTKSLFTGVFAF